MFRLSSGKSIFLTVLFLLGAGACGWRADSEAPAPQPSPFVPPEIVSEIPFSTKEPPVFQAEIVVSNFIDGEKTENKIFVARSGEQSLTTFNFGERAEHSIVKNAASGNELWISGEKKIFAEILSSGITVADDEAGLETFLTTEWLNGKKTARFENLGTENNLTRFRVRNDDAPNSETLIFVDENLKFPVRQEFYSTADGQRTLTVSVELKNFKPEADERLFQAPKNYKKVSVKEFRQIFRREN